MVAGRDLLLHDTGPPRERDNPTMDIDEPDFVVVGEKAALGPLRRDLAATYARWMNQGDVRRGLDYLGIATPESQEKWVDDHVERGAKREPGSVEFTIYDRASSAPVGTADLFRRGAVVSRGRPTDLVLVDAVPQDFGQTAF